jgi:hypothetical protein
MYLTVVLGPFVVGATGASVAALLMTVLVKTVLDLRAHLREHPTADEGPPAGEKSVAV